jgi:hypothetical protein
MAADSDSYIVHRENVVDMVGGIDRTNALSEVKGTSLREDGCCSTSRERGVCCSTQNNIQRTSLKIHKLCYVYRVEKHVTVNCYSGCKDGLFYFFGKYLLSPLFSDCSSSLRLILS